MNVLSDVVALAFVGDFCSKPVLLGYLNEIYFIDHRNTHPLLFQG